ncbi:MAG: hypothetical protein F6K22_34845 [Okeania sp. SIO2F4]|uniref:hypothetical protein n=1 Tax=Okeania sp. SIO2F4 TaxID=2607790 RepID=UPI00142BA4E8|nr:hypothetical protein [Okeania sp. SIO2F4]NES07519.1 hypothetical protein [Okeania sp. SIO2F4]
MQKSTQKFEQLPDKTPFLEKEQGRKTKQKEIPQTLITELSPNQRLSNTRFGIDIKPN